MLTGITLRGFRGFLDTTLETKPLTVLLGPNSSGKSSFCQAVVALRQIEVSKTGEPDLAPVERVGWPVDLGTYDSLHHDVDALNASDAITIGLQLGLVAAEFGFGGRAGAFSPVTLPLTSMSLLNAGYVPVSAAGPRGEAAASPTVVSTDGSDARRRSAEFRRVAPELWHTNEATPVELGFRGLKLSWATDQTTKQALTFPESAASVVSTFLQGVTYLAPNRLEPSRSYPDGEVPSIGSRGEGTAQMLHSKRGDTVSSATPTPLPHDVPSARAQIRDGWLIPTPQRLEDAVSAWMRHLGLATLVASRQDQGKIHLEAVIGNNTPRRVLTDVGFGLSQVLPVIVAGLLAPERSVVIFEQPESQLHPRAQAALADFLWMLSSSNRFVLVETHSEALFHRLRLRAMLQEEVLKNCAVYFLDPPDASGRCPEPRPVDLSPGGLVNWPKDFLAEGIREEEALSAIARARGEAA